MCDVISHRGPDDEGIYLDQKRKLSLGLGHRRLSIIDLTSSGHQPMSNEDGTVWITYNGEIYNHMELRKGLEEKGHHFKSNTDTEVILHLYEERGEDCLKYLNGMFAFAIWDERKEKLFLARDRLGIKPLFYKWDGKSFWFASEIKSILQDDKVEPEINYRALNDFFTFMYVPAPATIFKGIQKLEPGYSLVLKNKEVYMDKFWDLGPSANGDYTEEEYCREIKEKLSCSIERRLMSEVPLGVFLSGGIDSSSIVGLMSEVCNNTARTFSIGFGREKQYDELKFARIVAGKFNTTHSEYVVEPDAVEILPKLVWHFDEPFADSSAIPTYYVAQMAKENVTVALSGEGGDETFGGYPYRYFWDQIAERYRKMPYWIREKFIKKIASIIPLPKNISLQNKVRQLKKFLTYAGMEQERRYLHWFSIFTPELKRELYKASVLEGIEDINSYNVYQAHFDKVPEEELLQRMMYVDTKVLLPDDLLTKVDRTSMAHSLEVRVPFLDHELVEYAWNIPSALKLKGKTTKYILKKMSSQFLPDEIPWRKKQGFEVPISSWFKGKLNSYAKEMLSEETIGKRGYFEHKAIKNILDKIDAGVMQYGPHVYALIIFELWNRIFIDQKSN
jgi:asparagine synthase (glutamine-hydrolysing)